MDDDLTALLKGTHARLDKQHETLKHSPDEDGNTATLQDLGSSWKPRVQAEVKDLQSSIKDLQFKVQELTLKQQRKARRFWSPELHRRFVAALQRLGGAQVATPKQIRELMKVDRLTTDEVKIHLQNYRLHTRRRMSSDGGD